jgi:DnaK suppressor protein
MTKKQLDHIRSLLEQERERLTERLRPSHALEEFQDTQAADMMDRVDVDKTRDLLLSSESGDKQKWLAVNNALAKIDKGTYGVCEDCGQEIPYMRLEAYPTAELCVNCQRERESQQSGMYTPRPAKPVVLRGESLEGFNEEES